VAVIGKETPLLRHFYVKCIGLPRQARDKHRESTQKKSGCGFSGGGDSAMEDALVLARVASSVSSLD
jgi:hypothetical protein